MGCGITSHGIGINHSRDHAADSSSIGVLRVRGRARTAKRVREDGKGKGGEYHKC